MDQHVYAWSRSNLRGSQGFGLVAKTSGAPPPVGGAGMFIPEDRVELADTLDPAIECVEYRSSARGTSVRLMKYLGRDTSGRPGRRVVQTLHDPSGSVDGFTVALLAPAMLSRLDWPMDAAPDDELPPVTLTLADASDPHTMGGTTPPRDAVDLAVQAALEAGRSRAPVVVQGVADEWVIAVVREAWRLLPVALREKTSYSTFRGATKNLDVDVAFISPRLGVSRSGSDPSARVMTVADLPVDGRAGDVLRGLPPHERDQLASAEHVLDMHRFQRVAGRLDDEPTEADLLDAAVVWARLTTAQRTRVTALLDHAVYQGRLRLSTIEQVRALLPEPVVATLTRRAVDWAASLIVDGSDPREVAPVLVAWGAPAARVAQRVATTLANEAAANQGLPARHSAAALWTLQTAAVPPEVAVSWCTDPRVRDVVLGSFDATVQWVCRQVWIAPGWAAEHVEVVSRVVNRFEPQAVRELAALLGAGRGFGLRDVRVALLESDAAVLELARVVGTLRVGAWAPIQTPQTRPEPLRLATSAQPLQPPGVEPQDAYHRSSAMSMAAPAPPAASTQLDVQGLPSRLPRLRRLTFGPLSWATMMLGIAVTFGTVLLLDVDQLRGFATIGVFVAATAAGGFLAVACARWRRAARG